ncbi:MAG TPA: hypothetical protein VIK64_17730, partial [Anaerolineales bacterium]
THRKYSFSGMKKLRHRPESQVECRSEIHFNVKSGQVQHFLVNVMASGRKGQVITPLNGVGCGVGTLLMT